MRSPLAIVPSLVFLAVFKALAQTTGAPAPASPATAEVGGEVAEWWWIIVLLLVAGLVVWYFMRGRTRT
jgi:formate-dependent nitrite reductase membrane component NrfD